MSLAQRPEVSREGVWVSVAQNPFSLRNLGNFIIYLI